MPEKSQWQRHAREKHHLGEVPRAGEGRGTKGGQEALVRKAEL